MSNSKARRAWKGQFDEEHIISPRTVCFCGRTYTHSHGSGEVVVTGTNIWKAIQEREDITGHVILDIYNLHEIL